MKPGRDEGHRASGGPQGDQENTPFSAAAFCSIGDVAVIQPMSGASTDQAGIRAAIEQHDKRIATLRARCAIAGYELMTVNTGSGTSTFAVIRWGRSLDLLDANAVERWLDRIGTR